MRYSYWYGMEEIEKESSPGDSVDWTASPVVRVALPLLALIIATATLYFAREVLLPLAAALILGVVLSPIATRLERFLGRLLSAALVVLTGVALISAAIYFLSVELTIVADEVAGYSDNIGNKLAALEKSTPPWLQHLEYAVTDIQRRVQKPHPLSPPKPITQAVTIPSGSLEDDVKRAEPVLAAVVEVSLIVLLLFFILYSRRDLRDRLVRLAARAQITVASQALESAGRTVGHYLLLFTLINAVFGTAIGLVLWVLGLPYAVLWGLMAFLLRYIPYAGTLISALLPALVAFAVFSGWSKSLEVLGAFIILDQMTAHVIEPFIIGSGIDVSPVALLVSTMYWSWLWGLPGLLLAVPLTACLKVAGEHIPALNFLALLLGGERIIEDYQDFYRMLLELDQTGARGLAIRYCDEHGLEETFDDVLTPALNLAGEERAQSHISEENQQFMLESIRGLISDLGNRFYAPGTAPRVRVLGVCPPGEVHSLGLLMLLELFRRAGASVRFLGETRSVKEAEDFAHRFSPDVVCLSCTLSESLPAAAELTAALRRRLPHVTVIAGGIAAFSYPADLRRAGCAQVCGTRSETRRAIRQLAGAGRTRPVTASGTDRAENQNETVG